MQNDLTLNNIPLDRSFIFSGGEVQIRLPDLENRFKVINVVTKLTSSDAFMQLKLVADALRFYYSDYTTTLTINYLPYARQDRRCFKGEAYSLEVIITDLIGLGFDSIKVLDVHSNTKLPALFNQQNVLDVFIENPYMLNDVTAIVAPDKGAIDKVRTISDYFNIPMIVADKIRDTDKGVLLGIDIISNVDQIHQDAKLLVIDDICDGGGTFGLLGRAIENIETNVSMELYVTHGIFSKNLDPLTDYYSKVYSTDSFLTDDRIEFLQNQSNSTELQIIKL